MLEISIVIGYKEGVACATAATSRSKRKNDGQHNMKRAEWLPKEQGQTNAYMGQWTWPQNVDAQIQDRGH